jgi:hypothetical protein
MMSSENRFALFGIMLARLCPPRLLPTILPLLLSSVPRPSDTRRFTLGRGVAEWESAALSGEDR